MPPSRDGMQAILQGAAAASSLTKLVIDVWCIADGDESDVEEDEKDGYSYSSVAACGVLAQLTGLRDLRISEYSRVVAGDALALTALINLTRLVLNGLGSGVGSVAAVALVQSLPQLRHLDLRGCNLGSARAECVKGCEQLVHLTQLLL
jgi:hypothetical protein